MNKAAFLAIFGAGGAFVLAALKPSTRGIFSLFRGVSDNLVEAVEDTAQAVSDSVTDTVSAGVGAALHISRGIRNNNPGNIRSGQPWQGLSSEQRDPEFDQFISPEYGIRALGKLLTNYQAISGLNTIAQIIARYAPSNENNTQAYINSVASQTGLDPNEPIDVATNLERLIPAIIRHENGSQPYSAETILAGIALI